MKSEIIDSDNMNLISIKTAVTAGIVICICAACAVFIKTAYGQGTLTETMGTMEIGQQIDNGTAAATPKGAGGVRRPPQDANNAAQEPSRNPAEMQKPPVPPQPPADAQKPNTEPTAAEPAAMHVETADTNVFDANDFNSFKREIERIDMSSRGEDNQWLGKLEKKAELAQSMCNVVVAELSFIKKVAAAANDVNTVEAIDLVLKKRRERLQKLITKLENEAKEERQTPERRERRTTTRPAAGKAGQNVTERPSTNPVQRAREVTGGQD